MLVLHFSCVSLVRSPIYSHLFISSSSSSSPYHATLSYRTSWNIGTNFLIALLVKVAWTLKTIARTGASCGRYTWRTMIDKVAQCRAKHGTSAPPPWRQFAVGVGREASDKNSSGDEIANVYFLRRYRTKYRKREPTSFNKLDDS